jgi:hypothetical protein
MNHIIIHHIGNIKYTIIDKNHRNIAIGIVHVTSIFAIGAKNDICQKLNIIIGKVKLRDAKVNIKASFIANVSGKK